MDYQNARSELIHCGEGLVHRLADLDCCGQAKSERLVNELVSKVQASSRAQLQHFPSWRLVDEWLREVMKPLQPRKRFLVLHGPSCTGKTEFVRALFPPGAVLELNCANVQDICLEGFNCLRHRAIVWDAASASFVSNNRKVFQHPQCPVDVGHSRTGSHVRRYFLGNCCSVITTDIWTEDFNKLPPCDQMWLQANMVVCNVEQPLWEKPL